MVEISDYNGVGFSVVKEFEGWKIGFLRYSEKFSRFDRLERHLLTDEAFILLDGEAVLFTDAEKLQMQKCKIYNIPKGCWHHITVSQDATVMVVENSSTCAQNTEIKFF